MTKTKKKKEREKTSQDIEESVKYVDSSVEPHPDKDIPTREHKKKKTKKKKQREMISQDNEESVNYVDISVEPHPDKDIDNENEDTQDAQPNTDEVMFDYSELQYHDEKNDGNRDCTFHIPSHEWEIIKPEVKLYGRRQLPRRRLQKKWTDVFSKHISIFHPGCVLAFTTHWVKSSRSRKSSAPFIGASAICKGENCSGQFEINIPSEDGERYAHCRVKGHIQHDVFEVNRRNISGQDRFKMAKQIQQTTPAVVFNENLSRACPEEMELGNFSSVPNQGVLRKMVSELLKKEDLHSNMITELQILKENDELMGQPYIREIGLDPLVVLMFSDEQL